MKKVDIVGIIIALIAIMLSLICLAGCDKKEAQTDSSAVMTFSVIDNCYDSETGFVMNPNYERAGPTETQKQMILFSAQIKDKLKLSGRYKGGILFIGDYEITARSFPWIGWKSILIATPKGVSGELAGYSNTNVELPHSWHYIQKGTASEILPPTIIRSAIIDCL